MDNTDCVHLYEKYFPFWGSLTQADRDLLCRSSFSASYAKGDLVHGGNGECTGPIFVRSGGLRAYLLSENGKEVTLYRLRPGDVCMLSAGCVLKSLTFDVFVDAEEDSELFILKGSALADVTKRNLAAENFALSVAVERFSDVIWVMQQILFMSFDRRLALFLLDESQKDGSDTIRLTHEQIARYMGSAREVVSRMLKYFSSEGIVELSRGGVHILSMQKLRALTE